MSVGAKAEVNALVYSLCGLQFLGIDCIRFTLINTITGSNNLKHTHQEFIQFCSSYLYTAKSFGISRLQDIRWSCWNSSLMRPMRLIHSQTVSNTRQVCESQNTKWLSMHKYSNTYTETHRQCTNTHTKTHMHAHMKAILTLQKKAVYNDGVAAHSDNCSGQPHPYPTLPGMSSFTTCVNVSWGQSSTSLTPVTLWMSNIPLRLQTSPNWKRNISMQSLPGGAAVSSHDWMDWTVIGCQKSPNVSHASWLKANTCHVVESVCDTALFHYLPSDFCLLTCKHTHSTQTHRHTKTQRWHR